MRLENYDSRFVPPAPIVVIHVSDTSASRNTLVPALIDPGSDQTLISNAVIKSLNLTASGTIQIMSATGIMTCEKYAAIVSVSGLPAVPIEISGFDLDDHAILGRDFLNNFKITLDGPNLLFSIE